MMAYQMPTEQKSSLDEPPFKAALDAEELETIEIVSRNGQSGRITPFEIKELVRVYRIYLKEHAAQFKD